MDQLKKAQVLLSHLDEIVAAVDQALIIEDSAQRRAYLKSVLFYWMGVIYDDAAANEANLQIALSASQEMVNRLKEANKRLLKRISDLR